MKNRHNKHATAKRVVTRYKHRQYELKFKRASQNLRRESAAHGSLRSSVWSCNHISLTPSVSIPSPWSGLRVEFAPPCADAEAYPPENNTHTHTHNNFHFTSRNKKN